MQLEAIKVFCDLANLRSFSKAAEVNHRSQPAVSRIIHELERRLGGQLIDRSRRPLQLTALGQAYYQGCRHILEQYLELEASLLRTPPAMLLSIHVAAIYSVGLGDMGQFIERFEAQHPHARVHMEYVHPDQVYERLQDGSADFGLVSFPRPTRDLAAIPWREEEMVVACAPGHPLAHHQRIPVQLLQGEKFVGFDRGLTVRREIDRFLKEHGVAVDVVHEFDNIENIKKGIEIGVGVSLLPEPLLRPEVRRGVLCAMHLEGCRLLRPLGIIHRRRPAPAGAVLDFIDLLLGKDADSSSPGTDAVSLPAHPASNGDGQSTSRVRRKKRTVS
ncbi:MAG: LysR family transcriptional regulator [Gemmataceae bacterium]